MDKFFNFLGLAKRAGNIVEGYSRCDEQRNKKDFFLIIISNDASNSTRKKFKNHCIAKNIELIEEEEEVAELFDPIVEKIINKAKKKLIL